MERNVIMETERLILRRMDLSDFRDIAEMMQDIRVMYAWEYVFSDEEVREWIGRMCSRYEQYGYAYWIAQDKKIRRRCRADRASAGGGSRDSADGSGLYPET